GLRGGGVRYSPRSDFVPVRGGPLRYWYIPIAPPCRWNREIPPRVGRRNTTYTGSAMGTILLIILILILIGALPTWPYSSGWAYYPSGGAGLLVIILIVLLLAGRV